MAMMESYWKFYLMMLVGAFRLTVSALRSDNRDKGDEDPLSIPLINDKKVPLVVMLDTNAINRKIKVYIRTLMRDMIQSSMKEQMQGIFKTALEENSTVEFIRNITQKENDDFVKDHGQEDACILDNTPQTVEKRTQNTKTILNKSKGESEAMKILEILKQDTKAVCLRPNDCTELKENTMEKLSDGVYKIYPGGFNYVYAYCDMTTDGRVWTVLLKRYDGSGNFYRTWVEAENGFGDIYGDFWFGNKYTHMLTSSRKFELRVDMIDAKTKQIYAVYKTFVVGDAASKYKLTVGDYYGNAGDELKHHNGLKFSTFDQDNDKHDQINCAEYYRGAWWYKNCFASPADYKPQWGGPISKPVMMIRKV